MFSSILFLVLTLLAVALGMALYFLPTIIAQRKKHRSLGGIFVLNLLLGWSLLGWIGALVWALSNPQPLVVVQNGPAYLPQTYGAPSYPQQPVYPQQPGYPHPSAYPQQVHSTPIAPVSHEGMEYAAQPAVVITPAAGTDVTPSTGPAHLS